MASAVTGFLSVYGVDEPAGCYDDLDKCDVLIMWGNNMAEMHPVLFSRVIDRRTRGEKVTLIDLGTRRTRTTRVLRSLPGIPPAQRSGDHERHRASADQEERLRSEVRGEASATSAGTEGPAATPTAPLLGDAMSFDDYKDRDGTLHAGTCGKTQRRACGENSHAGGSFCEQGHPHHLDLVHGL
jgi:hypothetical protein